MTRGKGERGAGGGNPLCAYTRRRNSCACSRSVKVRVPPTSVSRTASTRSRHTQSVAGTPSIGATAEDAGVQGAALVQRQIGWLLRGRLLRQPATLCATDVELFFEQAKSG